ncbi:Obp56d family protein [Megaselia abdita]
MERTTSSTYILFAALVSKTEITFPNALRKCSPHGELKMAQKILVGQPTQRERDFVTCGAKCVFGEKKFVKEGKIDEEYIKYLTGDLTGPQKNLINSIFMVCKEKVPLNPTGVCEEYKELINCIENKLTQSEKIFIALGISYMSYM